MEKRFEPMVQKAILSVLSGWLITQFFCLLFHVDAGVSVSFAAGADLLIFAVAVVVFSALVFLGDCLYPDKNVSAYAFVLSLPAFAFALLLKRNDMYVYLFMTLLIMITFYCFNKKYKPQFFHTELSTPSVTVIIVTFTVIACTMTLLMALFRYLTYSAPGYDFGIFCNMFHSMKTDFSMNTTCERNKLLSHLAVHISPIYYLILPIYYIFPSPVTLNVIQPLIIYSGVIPLYLLTKKLKLSRNAGTFLCAAFSLYAPLAAGCFYDLHENCFMVPLLLWMFYFCEAEKYIPMFLFAVLTLTVKEDAFVYVAIFALYLILTKKQYLKGGGMLVMSAAYFALCCFILSRLGEGVMESRYSNLQTDGGLLQVAKTLLMNTGFAVGEIFKTETGGTEKFIYLAQMLMPLAFIPLKSKNYSRYLLLLPIFVNLLTQYKYQYDIGYQYSFSIAAFLFYLSALNLSEMKPKKQNRLTLTAATAAALLFVMIVIPKSVSYIQKYNTYKDSYRQMNEAIATIPDDASVTASAHLIPKLAQRAVIYEDEYHETPDTEYFVLDIRGGEKAEARRQKYIDAGYELILKVDYNLEIYQNKQMANNQ